MKTKLFLLSILGAFALLVSCDPPEPDSKEMTAESCMELMKSYYPYSLDEDFVFVNDSLNLRWEAKAYDAQKKGIYPWPHIYKWTAERKEGAWDCDIHAWVLENGVSPYAYGKSQISTNVSYNPNTEFESPFIIYWVAEIYLSGEDKYQADEQFYCRDATELSSTFTDTIILPINYHSTHEPIPEGSYVRIVKNVGITDLSFDGGKTVWRRIKE